MNDKAAEPEIHSDPENFPLPVSSNVIEFGESLTEDQLEQGEQLEQEVAFKLGMTTTELRALRDLPGLLDAAAYEEFKQRLMEITEEVAHEHAQRR